MFHLHWVPSILTLTPLQKPHRGFLYCDANIIHTDAIHFRGRGLSQRKGLNRLKLVYPKRDQGFLCLNVIRPREKAVQTCILATGSGVSTGPTPAALLADSTSKLTTCHPPPSLARVFKSTSETQADASTSSVVQFTHLCRTCLFSSLLSSSSCGARCLEDVFGGCTS